MLLFGALCHVVGPQNGFGDIFCCCKKEKAKNENDSLDYTQQKAKIMES